MIRYNSVYNNCNNVNDLITLVLKDLKRSHIEEYKKNNNISSVVEFMFIENEIKIKDLKTLKEAV